MEDFCQLLLRILLVNLLASSVVVVVDADADVVAVVDVVDLALAAQQRRVVSSAPLASSAPLVSSALLANSVAADVAVVVDVHVVDLLTEHQHQQLC